MLIYYCLNEMSIKKQIHHIQLTMIMYFGRVTVQGLSDNDLFVPPHKSRKSNISLFTIFSNCVNSAY